MPTDHDNTLGAGAPVNIVDTGSAFDSARNPEPGIARCLSEGGYRAMLFHLGALWRLNEWGYLLSTIPARLELARRAAAIDPARAIRNE
jgi:hypothetical protein